MGLGAVRRVDRPLVLRPAGPPAPGEGPGWLHKHQERWAASDQPWDGYVQAWAGRRGCPGGDRVRGLDPRFDCQRYVEGPYFFADLADTSEAEEQAAIDAGLIQAGGIPVRRHAALTQPPAGLCRPGDGAAGRAPRSGQRLADCPSLSLDPPRHRPAASGNQWSHSDG